MSSHKTDDNFTKSSSSDKITNTPLAIAYMLAFCVLNAVCQSLSKYATTKQGVNPIEWCFVRSFSLFVVSIFQLKFNGKNPIYGIYPEHKEEWEEFEQQKRRNFSLVFVRAISGTVAYTCVVFAVMYIPVFVMAVILNTAPFFTAILGWIISKETVTNLEIFFMVGSFAGISYLALQSGTEERISASGTNLAVGIAFSMVTSIGFSLVMVSTRRLKEIHYSIMIFWYAATASSFYLVVILANYFISNKKFGTWGMSVYKTAFAMVFLNMFA